MKWILLLLVLGLAGCAGSDLAPDKADLKLKADRANEYDGAEGGLTWEF